MLQDLNHPTRIFHGCGVFPALAALHNYILEKDTAKLTNMLPPSDDDIADRIEDNGQLATEYPR